MMNFDSTIHTIPIFFNLLTVLTTATIDRDGLYKSYASPVSPSTIPAEFIVPLAPPMLQLLNYKTSPQRPLMVLQSFTAALWNSSNYHRLKIPRSIVDITRLASDMTQWPWLQLLLDCTNNWNYTPEFKALLVSVCHAIEIVVIGSVASNIANTPSTYEFESPSYTLPSTYDPDKLTITLPRMSMICKLLQNILIPALERVYNIIDVVDDVTPQFPTPPTSPILQESLSDEDEATNTDVRYQAYYAQRALSRICDQITDAIPCGSHLLLSDAAPDVVIFYFTNGNDVFIGKVERSKQTTLEFEYIRIAHIDQEQAALKAIQHNVNLFRNQLTQPELRTLFSDESVSMILSHTHFIYIPIHERPLREIINGVIASVALIPSQALVTSKGS
ncbi:hypothetical protein [Lutzomyia reovirus 1]|uniref:hypothetical protein n=1 Tax=Lutzomyia reovirus 1 TaxID=1670669 RepID=UPI00065EEB15|nr:hypothetical protein [Lutzomyia reovirus 1]AKP18609.1 hypothetical protein [Lutzomyia reovirus 1]